MRIPDSEVRIVEAGAHDGQLAKDILDLAAIQPPGTFRANRILHHRAFGPPPGMAARNAEFAPRVRWFDSFHHILPKSEIRNPKSKSERRYFLQRTPRRLSRPPLRLGREDKNWFEWGVAVDGEKFVWARIPDTLAPRSGERAGARGFDPSSILHLPSSLLAVLPDGYTVEISPAAENWWREAAGILERGKLLTIDYGLTADELFSPTRRRGTLRAYFRHHASDDILANVGEQDFTAHVNFSAIQKAGEEAGLKTELFRRNHNS